jgi:hypothetical protein
VWPFNGRLQAQMARPRIGTEDASLAISRQSSVVSRQKPGGSRRSPVVGRWWTTDSSRAGERGQGTLEFLLAFPLVVTVLLGIVELGVIVFSYSTIANAAHEGARYGALHPAAVSGTCANPSAGIGDAVCRLTVGLDNGQVHYTATVDGEVLRVAVTYQYRAISGPMGWAVGHGGVLALSATAATIIE